MNPLPASVGPVAPRIAVLIDGDNIPRTFRPEIDRQARLMGNLVTCQLFGDITLHSDWSKETGIDMHHCAGKPGSNAADIALVIAALDLAYRGLAQAFLIVSNDRDFEPLLRHLTKIGCVASILKTPAKAPVTGKTTDGASPPVVLAPRPAPDEVIVAKVRDMIRNNGGPDGLRLALLNNLFSRNGFRVSQTPEKQWRPWLLARPQHFELDPKGPESRVRVIGAKP